MSTEKRGNLAKFAAEFRARVESVIKPHREAAAEARKMAQAEKASKEARIQAARANIEKLDEQMLHQEVDQAFDRIQQGVPADAPKENPLKDLTEEKIDTMVSELGQSPVETAVKRFESGQPQVKSYTEEEIKQNEEQRAADLEAAVNEFKTGPRDPETTRKIDEMLEETKKNQS